MVTTNGKLINIDGSTADAKKAEDMAAKTPVSPADIEPGVILNVNYNKPNEWQAALKNPTAKYLMVSQKWSELEPEPGKYVFGDIRAMLADCKAYKKKLIWGFLSSGGDAMPTHYTGPKIMDGSQSYPIFWSGQYLLAMRNLLNAFAAEFADDPELAAVSLGGCSTTSFELNGYDVAGQSPSVQLQLRDAGVPISARGKITPTGSDPYSGAVYCMMGLYDVVFAGRKRIVYRIHLPLGNTAQFDQAVIDGILARPERSIMGSTGFHDEDCANLRQMLSQSKAAHPALKAACLGTSNPGSTHPDWTQEQLWAEIAKQIVGGDDAPPPSQVSFAVFDQSTADRNILSLPSTLAWLEERLIP